MGTSRRAAVSSSVANDVTHLAFGPDEDGARTFAEGWNHETYQAARGFFHSRDVAPELRTLACWACPTTIFYERWREHAAAGGTEDDFDSGMELGSNAAWNYFWTRGQITGRERGDPT